MADTWFLKVDDEIFGPQTRECMIEWAKLGKILPGHRISNDNENWQDVTDVPFLDMRWSIDIGDGVERGPFNRIAAETLLKSGRLPEESRIIEVRQAWEAEESAEAESVLPEEAVTVEPEPAVTVEPEAEPAAEEAAAEEKQPVVEEETFTLESPAVTIDDSDAKAKAADAQTALYALMRDEAEDLLTALEAEKKEAEDAQRYWQKRSERLIKRRQELLKWIGGDADAMTRRALNIYPEDPRTVHLRQELDALRVLQERSAKETEQRIRDLSDKLRDKETEVRRLTQQTGDMTVLYRQLQESRERLQLREKELMEERQKAEVFRQQQEAAQQALLARISSLELGAPGATHQSREARSVKLAPWMGLKK